MQLRQFLSLSALLVLGSILCGCSSTGPFDGPSSGYSTAKFIGQRPNRLSGVADSSEALDRMIRESITSQFQERGIAIRPGYERTELIIAHMLLLQNGGTAANFSQTHGYDASDVTHPADDRRLESGTLVIDLIDARTDKVVYRNYAQRANQNNPSEAGRRQRVDEAVAEALAGFFR